MLRICHCDWDCKVRNRENLLCHATDPYPSVFPADDYGGAVLGLCVSLGGKSHEDIPQALLN